MTHKKLRTSSISYNLRTNTKECSILKKRIYKFIVTKFSKLLYFQSSSLKKKSFTNFEEIES